MSAPELLDWPRIRDLPKEEQDAFELWLYGKTVPMLDNVSKEEQDGYYPWDYRAFKAGYLRP